MKGEKMEKRSSFGSVMRKRLSDITNSHLQEDKLSHFNEDLINQLLKEKATLMKLVEERNKIIELSGNELRNMRMNYQKLQLQNRNLAQSNAQMLVEINVGREKLKALQHELLCKEALLKIKVAEPEAAADTNIQSNVQKEVEKSAFHSVNNTKLSSNGSRRRTARTMGASAAHEQVTDKDKAETKRRCLRRQSARFKSQEREQEDNFFEIEEVRISVGTPVKEEEESIRTQCDTTSQNNISSRAQGFGRRNSEGRAVRRAAEKVQSYKELPLKAKMRRAE